MQIPNLVIVGPVTDISGVAETLRSLYLAFFDIGIKVKLVEIPGWSHLKADLSPIIREKIQFGLERNDLGGGPIVTIHFYPPHAVQRTPHIEGSLFDVSHTVFETDKAPLVWRDVLNGKNFVENWVPCQFQIDAYSSIGIDKNKMKVIPLGVDSDRFNPEVKPLPIEGKKKFTIMTSLDWSDRKNPEGIILSYLQEFNNEPDACLVIKSYTGYADEESRNFIRGKISRLRMLTRSNATILFIPDFLHYDLIPSFHKAADVWLNLSRGEGWDLGSLQSLACGVPVVGSDNTSHKSYLTSDNGYLVPCTKTLITNKDFLSRNPQFLDHSWYEPNLKEARKQMRQAFDDFKSGALVEKSTKARASVLGINWKVTATRMLFEIGKYLN